MSEMIPPIVDEVISNLEEIPLPEQEKDVEELLEEKGIPVEYQELIKKAVQDLIRPEDEVRTRLLSILRRNELYWDGKQRLAWDSDIASYRNPQDFSAEELRDFDIDPSSLNGIINITKAHGESIIGAMATGTPTVRFPPKDVNKAIDIIASRAKSKIAEYIGSQNHSDELMVRALAILMKQNFVAAHNYNLTSDEFGTYEKKSIEERVEDTLIDSCPMCQMGLGGISPEQNSIGQSVTPCPNCGGSVIPEQIPGKQVIQEEVVEIFPESKEVIDLYGPRNVRIPLYCTDLKKSPYLILEVEDHVTRLQDMFPAIREKITPENDLVTKNTWSRLPYQYFGATKDTATVRYCWIRPWGLEILGEKNREEIQAIKGTFKKGLVLILVNDVIADIFEESLDEHWTIGKSPTAEYLHDEPMMNVIIPLQDMTNDLVDLTMETIREGIAETFADPEVVNFDAYSNHEASPGKLIPARPRMGLNLDGSFFQTKTATLSREVEYFQAFLTTSAQFVMGSFPSIYGGQLTGAHTASEYAQSRNQALQRLSIKWKMLISTWGTVINKAVESFIQAARESGRDEISYTKKTGRDSYTNVLIKLEELSGETGSAEANVSEEFPSSWAQKRQDFMEIISTNNPALTSSIFTPNNIETVYELLGITQLQIPGEEDKNKQLMENAELLRSQPMMSPQGLMPSITPDVELDDDQIHIQVCREFLLGPEGFDAKINNKPGYDNVFAHYMQHVMHMMQKQQEQMIAEAQANANSGGKTPPGKAPPQGDKTVNLPGES